MASSGTTPMLDFDEKTLLGILDKLFDEIKSEYDFVLQPEALSSSVNPEPVKGKEHSCGEAFDEMIAEIQKINLENNKDNENSNDESAIPIDNSTDYSLNNSSDKPSAMSIEGSKDEPESSHDQNEKSILVLNPKAKSPENSLNNSSDESSFRSTEETEDGFESSHDENEKSTVSALKYINVIMRKTRGEIGNLIQLESQSDKILSNITKYYSSRSSSPFPNHNLSKPSFVAMKYATKTHADILKILESEEDQNITETDTLFRQIRFQRRARCVFVENIDYPIETIDVVDHFTPCGTLACVRVYREQNGYALLEFINPISAHTALTMDGTLFRGRTINVMIIEAVGQQGIRTKRYDESMTYNKLGNRYRRPAIKHK